MQYLKEVRLRKVYPVDLDRGQPWHKNPHLREEELVKVIGVRYEIRPPRLVCLKLSQIDPDTGRMCGGSFSIKYHDMADVIDFIILRQTYESAIRHRWKVGDRFRSLIDDAWWIGEIVTQEPFSEEYPDSQFQCFNVKWDTGEHEKMSPWDLEPIDEQRMSG
ncbi:hypothetical protein CAPTEDRAFT_122519 [Capitella teleta]|uniref:BRWD/PHIP ancillary-like domain-containing protein n=1 Tax=Capitella teleta TaxID=283909 RepID=R7TZR6_CAPTE|nr:hypothetical protein CAPTEDRAFT_122519 [Capitella teleta]|eukprot:ELT96425.1 hypothetical protein CAPTEDRAFT_122519 [Capitella teleta]